ncbi:MAG TPA: carbon-nitrogen hydrolase family protein [Fimbriimonas sp.]|nr:carbon-nitrogen hydrolase family protein [Fimbriimonas sp.]
MVRVASVQMDVVFGNPEANAVRIAEHLKELSSQGVHVAIFPECVLTGYCVSTRDDALAIAIDAGHSSLVSIKELATSLCMTVILGFAERQGDELYNSVAVFLCSGEEHIYRKTHLPELGYDKFVTPGDEFVTVETHGLTLGVLICFDIRAPENCRCLALAGCDLIAIPTNWPSGAEISADVLCIARANENMVYIATCNRVGDENGFHFIGKSKILSPAGDVLASADDNQAVLVCDIDPELARSKRMVRIPGKHETTIFESRRPDLYGPICEARQ